LCHHTKYQVTTLKSEMNYQQETLQCSNLCLTLLKTQYKSGSSSSSNKTRYGNTM